MKTVHILALSALLILLATPTLAGMTPERVGASLGIVSPSYLDSTVGFQLHMDTGDAARGWSVQPSLSYWSSDLGLVSYSTLSVGANGRYSYPLGTGKTRVFGGAGLGLYRASVSGGSESISETNFGIDFLGGAETDLSEKLSGFAQLQTTAGLTINATTLSVGVNLGLGR